MKTSPTIRLRILALKGPETGGGKEDERPSTHNSPYGFGEDLLSFSQVFRPTQYTLLVLARLDLTCCFAINYYSGRMYTDPRVVS